MKNLFEAATVAEVKARIARLGATSERQWGTMNAAQAMAHVSSAMEWAVGDTVAPRMFLGRVIGGAIKPLVLKDDKPMRRNTGTVKTLVVTDERDLKKEQARLIGLLDRFARGGAAGCTRNPHSFFGRMTPDEWAILMYKHTDHHLRQFGV
jgi:hypothetical protein